VYEFVGFFARPAVPRPLLLCPDVVWREIDSRFHGIGVRLPVEDRDILPTPSDVEALARQCGLEAAECWVYLNYVCWGGHIDFVYGIGSRRGVRFGPVQEDAQDLVEAAYIGLMEQFGLSAAVAMQFEPFRRGYWGEV
jgi:hypothetical protein